MALVALDDSKPCKLMFRWLWCLRRHILYKVRLESTLIAVDLWWNIPVFKLSYILCTFVQFFFMIERLEFRCVSNLCQSKALKCNSSIFMLPRLSVLRFLCLRPVGCRRHYVFGLSVRPSVRTGISLTQNLKNPLVDFYHTWPRGAPWRVDELIRFWARSAQGQRSKVNELGLNMLYLPR